MEPNEYRRRCSAPGALPRHALEQTQYLLADLNPLLTHRILRVLESEPIPKPPEHGGGPETDFFEVRLAPRILSDLVSFLGSLEADAVATGEGRRAREIGSLLDRWNRCRVDLDEAEKSSA